MIFLTVGTQFPFDRLVRAIDKAVVRCLINEKMFAQIGKSSYKPRNFEYVEFLDKDLFDDCIRQASCIISHAGMGTITMALDNSKPLLVMPRLRRHGEVVNDHQLAIAKKFEQLGLILTAYEVEELPERIEWLRTFVPSKREPQTRAVAERIMRFLRELS